MIQYEGVVRMTTDEILRSIYRYGRTSKFMVVTYGSVDKIALELDLSKNADGSLTIDHGYGSLTLVEA